MTEIEMLYCPTCARVQLAEAPPCPDGHDDCPDRACLQCGTALVVDAGFDTGFDTGFDSGFDTGVGRPGETPRRNVA